MFEPPLATYKAVPARLVVIDSGNEPLATAGDAIRVSAPLAWSMLYTEIVPVEIIGPPFATKANVPPWLIVIELGSMPLAKGEPAIGTSAPVASSILKAETLADSLFAT